MFYFNCVTLVYFILFMLFYICSTLQVVLGPLIAIALKISNIHERTGRRGPNVITWAARKTHAHAHTCIYLLTQRKISSTYSSRAYLPKNPFCAASFFIFLFMMSKLKVLYLLRRKVMLYTVLADVYWPLSSVSCWKLQILSVWTREDILL